MVAGLRARSKSVLDRGHVGQGTAAVTWWRRALGALRPRAPAFDRVRWSDDAAAVVGGVAGEDDRALAELCESAELAALFRALGIEPGALAGVKPSAPFARVALIAKATVWGAGRDEARCGDLLYALLRSDAACAQALEAAGVTRAKVTTFLAHGVIAHDPPAAATAPRGEELELMLHNDDFTPQDFVVKVLVDIVGLDRRVATTHMFEVHERGGSVVATLPRAKAIDAAVRILERGRAAGFPLLVTLESFT